MFINDIQKELNNPYHSYIFCRSIRRQFFLSLKSLNIAFITQACFKSSWKTHKVLHKKTGKSCFNEVIQNRFASAYM